MRFLLLGILLCATSAPASTPEPLLAAFRPMTEGPSELVDAAAPEQHSPYCDVGSLERRFHALVSGGWLGAYEAWDPEAEDYSTGTFLQVLVDEVFVGEKALKKKNVETVIRCLRAQRMIDDVAYTIFERELDRSVVSRRPSGAPFLVPVGPPRFPVSIATYLRRRISVSGARSVPATSPEQNPLGRKSWGVELEGVGKVSPRTRLYASFDENQILAMSRLLEVAQARINALGGAQIVFKHEGESCDWCAPDGMDAVEIDPNGQYLLALQIFEQLFRRMKMSEQFSRSSPTYLDVVAAAHESGAIGSPEVQPALEYALVGGKRLPRWKKFVRGVNGLVPVESLATFAPVPPLLLAPVLLGVSMLLRDGQKDPYVDRIFK